MPIDAGLRAVKNLVEGNGTRTAQTPAELAPLFPQVQQRAKQFDKCYHTCTDDKGDRCLAYTFRSHELEMWHIGLMFVEYVAALLLKKAEEGHCYAEHKT